MKPLAAFWRLPSPPPSPPKSHRRSIGPRYAAMRIDDKGFITSLTSRQSGKEYCPAGHPSPLLSLHEDGSPTTNSWSRSSAAFHPDKKEIALKYANGATAVVKAEAKDTYFRFRLVSLTPRGKVDNIVWGPLHTTVSKIIGDIIGVVRDDDWAIGMLGLDDNTIAGPVVDGDCYGMGYYVHSPDPLKYPVPPQYKEGQWFNIGGNGVNDTAFYSHPEEYFQQVFGTGATLQPTFGSTVAYHARDRRKSYVHYFALLPGFKAYRPRHMVSDPVEGVDFLGSAVALYACPDDRGLATLERITKDEGLPYVTIDGKWLRDPAAIGPSMFWNGPVDKAIEYTKAMGFNDISRDTGDFYSNRPTGWVGGVGFSNGKSMTYKEFSDECHKNGLGHGGLHCMCMFLQGGLCHDVTPVPSKHLQTVCRTKLAKDISATDTEIVVDGSLLPRREGHLDPRRRLELPADRRRNVALCGHQRCGALDAQGRQARPRLESGAAPGRRRTREAHAELLQWLRARHETDARLRRRLRGTHGPQRHGFHRLRRLRMPDVPEPRLLRDEGFQPPPLRELPRQDRPLAARHRLECLLRRVGVHERLQCGRRWQHVRPHQRTPRHRGQGHPQRLRQQLLPRHFGLQGFNSGWSFTMPRTCKRKPSVGRRPSP